MGRPIDHLRAVLPAPPISRFALVIHALDRRLGKPFTALIDDSDRVGAHFARGLEPGLAGLAEHRHRLARLERALADLGVLLGGRLAPFLTLTLRQLALLVAPKLSSSATPSDWGRLDAPWPMRAAALGDRDDLEAIEAVEPHLRLGGCLYQNASQIVALCGPGKRRRSRRDDDRRADELELRESLQATVETRPVTVRMALGELVSFANFAAYAEIADREYERALGVGLRICLRVRYEEAGVVEQRLDAVERISALAALERHGLRLLDRDARLGFALDGPDEQANARVEADVDPAVMRTFFGRRGRRWESELAAGLVSGCSLIAECA